MSKTARTSKNKIPKVSSFINQPTTKFRQSSPVNLQSFERHLDKLHLIGNQSKGGPLLVPIQNYDQKSASPKTTVESLENTFKPIKEEEEDEEMLKKNNAKLEYKSDEDDVFGQFVAIDRGGKRKKKYKSYKIKKKTTKRKRKTRRKTRKRTRRKTKRKMMGKK